LNHLWTCGPQTMELFRHAIGFDFLWFPPALWIGLLVFLLSFGPKNHSVPRPCEQGPKQVAEACRRHARPKMRSPGWRHFGLIGLTLNVFVVEDSATLDLLPQWSSSRCMTLDDAWKTRLTDSSAKWLAVGADADPSAKPERERSFTDAVVAPGQFPNGALVLTGLCRVTVMWVVVSSRPIGTCLFVGTFHARASCPKARLRSRRKSIVVQLDFFLKTGLTTALHPNSTRGWHTQRQPNNVDTQTKHELPTKKKRGWCCFPLLCRHEIQMRNFLPAQNLDKEFSAGIKFR
jgi:hypothetical protein